MRRAGRFQQNEKRFILSAASDSRISVHPSVQDHDVGRLRPRFSSALSETIDLSPVTALVHSLPRTFVPSLQPAPEQNAHALLPFPTLHDPSRSRTMHLGCVPVFEWREVVSLRTLRSPVPILPNLSPFRSSRTSSVLIFMQASWTFFFIPVPPALRLLLLDAPERVVIFSAIFTIILFISSRLVTLYDSPRLYDYLKRPCNDLSYKDSCHAIGLKIPHVDPQRHQFIVVHCR